jgi:hypothetical protein
MTYDSASMPNYEGASVIYGYSGPQSAPNSNHNLVMQMAFTTSSANAIIDTKASRAFLDNLEIDQEVKEQWFVTTCNGAKQENSSFQVFVWIKKAKYRQVKSFPPSLPPVPQFDDERPLAQLIAHARTSKAKQMLAKYKTEWAVMKPGPTTGKTSGLTTGKTTVQGVVHTGVTVVQVCSGRRLQAYSRLEQLTFQTEARNALGFFCGILNPCDAGEPLLLVWDPDSKEIREVCSSSFFQSRLDLSNVPDHSLLVPAMEKYLKGLGDGRRKSKRTKPDSNKTAPAADPAPCKKKPEKKPDKKTKQKKTPDETLEKKSKGKNLKSDKQLGKNSGKKGKVDKTSPKGNQKDATPKQAAWRNYLAFRNVTSDQSMGYLVVAKQASAEWRYDNFKLILSVIDFKTSSTLTVTIDHIHSIQ